MNLMSILVGILPESIFFTLFFIYAKNIKQYRATFFGMIFVLNIILSYLFAFTIYYHVLLIVGMYGILYLLYHSHIIDIFLITSASLILAVLGYLCFYGIPNYNIATIINRGGMFVVLFIIHGKLNYCYTMYKKYWNRTSGSIIKSITVRNISCILLNVGLYVVLISWHAYNLNK